MLLFQPYQITHSGVSLGQTRSGVEFAFQERTELRHGVNGQAKLLHVLIGLYGTIHKVELEQMSVTDDLLRGAPGQLVFTAQDHVITVNNAQLLFPQQMRGGALNQEPFDLRFFAPRNGSELIKIEEV